MRHVLLIALMAFTLAGAQLAQASPLHDHAQHSVDCALCHLQLSDDVLARVEFAPVARSNARPAVLAPAPFYTLCPPSPFQGRAPPRFFS